MKKGLFIFVLLTSFITASAQQDAQFSQYIFNGLYINPAYAGYKSDFYVNSFYRSQWTGLNGAPQTTSIAADGSVANDKVGLGLLLQRDQIGAQNNIAAYTSYAYRLQIGENENSRLAFGLGVGLIQSGLDGNKLNPVQSGDNYIPTGYHSFLSPDARLGVLYTNDDYFIGASVDNLLPQYMHSAQNVSSLGVPVPKPHEYFTTGALFNLSDQNKFKPSILIKDSPTVPTSMDVNAFLLLNDRLWLGATYRTAITLYNKPNLQKDLPTSSALVGIVEFFVTENVRIGYAFDYSLNKIGALGYGSHEISIGFLLKNSNSSRSRFNDPTRKCYF
ncbi:type IX secretion system membrane protein PorP/SprF [Mucilaginibacter sp. UR6-11]|uniref:PorP/SprF family type IX secretion system membrane protein n=1 Tax=Mucilaginibacter sp. UR6-11 TaxID=1435644 RepID=UPI001E5E5219|nr:type IX secretion system membrane protein PorP/SprF [Mucilaginibacter sp. UR6-11]MCC8424528.1 type IX secretion system membrane protein PorP/SprF [Mucilaginibacter sp. UR6-11]